METYLYVVVIVVVVVIVTWLCQRLKSLLPRLPRSSLSQAYWPDSSGLADFSLC